MESESERGHSKKKCGESVEESDIEELLGIAMGCIGMSMDDFCRCTPSEFRATWNVWHEMHEQRERGAWERMRMECLCTLQPYSNKSLEAKDIMQFPWDAEKNEKETGKIDKEEMMRRYREAKAAANLK